MNRPIVESENAARSWQLQREYEPDFARAEAIIAPIVDADLVLAESLFDPILVTAQVELVDLTHGFRDGLAPSPSWRLSVDSPAARASGWQPAETQVLVEAIDRSALERFVRTASAQPADEGHAVAPVALWLNGVRARLPARWADGDDRLLVRFQGGTQEVAIERDARGASVSGPFDSLLTPPIFTYGRVHGRQAQLTIEAHWSPWYEEGAPGTLAIERAVAGLEARGWRRGQ